MKGRGGREGKEERVKDATLLVLKTENQSNRPQAEQYKRPESWKEQGNGFSPRASLRNASLLTC